MLLSNAIVDQPELAAALTAALGSAVAARFCLRFSPSEDLQAHATSTEHNKTEDNCPTARLYQVTNAASNALCSMDMPPLS